MLQALWGKFIWTVQSNIRTMEKFGLKCRKENIENPEFKKQKDLEIHEDESSPFSILFI